MSKLHKRLTLAAVVVLIAHTTEKIIDRVFDLLLPPQQVAQNGTSSPDYGGVYAEPKSKVDYYDTATPKAQSDVYDTYTPYGSADIFPNK